MIGLKLTGLRQKRTEHEHEHEPYTMETIMAENELLRSLGIVVPNPNGLTGSSRSLQLSETSSGAHLSESSLLSSKSGNTDTTNGRFQLLESRSFSDFTIPTSNHGSANGLAGAGAAVTPGMARSKSSEHYGHLHHNHNHNNNNHNKPRRAIFGTTVQRKYAVDDTGTGKAGAAWNDHPREPREEQPHYRAVNGDSLYQVQQQKQPQSQNITPTGLGPGPVLMRVVPLNDNLGLSPLTLESNGAESQKEKHEKQKQHMQHASLLTTKAKRPHETIHAQSLLLGLAFAAVWSPSNLMAPNLTEIATDFGFDQYERDLYLGSYCALATGVLSFPIGAGIGILTDLVSRQRLFCVTVAGGALSSIATGLCTGYWQLFLARLLTGGFMSGSVPVVFSFLGDLFATEERNAASSGLTAMMGLGIIMGQVYAGMVGSTEGWPHAFFVSGAISMVLAVLCLFLVQEPVRGGKEKVLQDMLKAGTRYERKLTWKGFLHTIRHNESNTILLWQGFFSSLPWGIIFVFLNDYLSQERQFSVPDATFLVFLFGIGCAAGGVLGGYWGQKIQAMDRSYLPLFMSATTLLGILPFLGLLNSHFTNAHGPRGMLFSISGGLIASLPAVNVRPVLINVNPPETRGASLTAANLLINLGRGFGPSCITLMGTIWHVDRKFAFSFTVSGSDLSSKAQYGSLVLQVGNV
jgi:MFS family permease